MNRSTLRRSTGIAAAALTLTMGLAACGSESDSGSDDSGSSSDSSSTSGDDSMSESPSESAAADTGTFGPGCAQIPASGAGSLDGMATAPVADAASANPLLSTLVTAVGKAGLVDALNTAPELTVFAPANDAFAAIPKKDLDALLKDKPALTTVLTHHVIPQNLAPDQVTGEFDTLAKDKLMIQGTGENMTVGPDEAKVLCGGIQTANATVYVIDSVLMPQM